MGPEARTHRLEKLGVERLYELNFNASLSALTPQEFAQNVIATGLGLRHVVVGADFCFGKGRAGNAQDLCASARIWALASPSQQLLEGEIGEVSSTAIRTALTEGRPRDAAAMLGHWHRIEGTVIGGEQRGRDLGYPTANMSIDGPAPAQIRRLCGDGRCADGPARRAATTARPHLACARCSTANVPNLETFLFDFTGDLYGADLSVALVDYLRPEETFDSLDALIAQMDADCARARAILSAL